MILFWRIKLTYKVIHTKSFNGDLRKIQSQGQKKIVQAVRAAMTEAGTAGEIKSLPRTKHGESRIPNVEKYDLPDAYRLVVQLVDGVQKSRAFLFVGNHDEAEHWLDTHKHYKWVKSESDGVLNFVLVTIPEEIRHVPADRLNLHSTEEWLQKPILHSLTKDDWKKLNIEEKTRRIVDAVSGVDFEQDADGVLEELEKSCGYKKASLLFDLMWHSHAQEWQELRHRIDLLDGGTNILDASEVEASMTSIENSESFITFDDKNLLDDFLSKNNLADWMLFLHPDQKSVAEKELRGAARLRGVSGSGKTCVLVHRARHLAKKYNQPVLLVTLTESMRKLLERLADDLCGVERSLIATMTMSMLAKDTLAEFVENRLAIPHPASSEKIEEIIRSVASFVRKHPDVEKSTFSSMTNAKLTGFLQGEISYVRGRLSEEDTEKYLDSKQFQRRGRGVPLGQLDRKIVLEGINHYRQALSEANLQDHEGFVFMAINEVGRPNVQKGKFRCILSDEVQDLSELDLSLMGMLRTPSGELMSKAGDGLFLAGDGAQSIYKRGFVLRRIGIDIVGRSFSLKKNYRNTHEILKAAFGLVSQYEFADIDEENISRPSLPDFAKCHGARPLLVRCNGIEDEAEIIARNIESSLAMGQSPGQICVIGPNVKARTEIDRALRSKAINTAELRNDVDYESDNVKISTIESAKGHEFSSVYIMGLIEGVLPAARVEGDEIPREASRLYVAMTRARERLTITYSPGVNSPASRFLTAIQSDCDEAHIRNGELRMIA